MEGCDENDPIKTSNMVKKSSGSLFSYLYLENSDHDKYISIIQSLNSQKSLGNNQHPRTIVDTNNMLSNHKFDMYKHKKQDNKHPKSNKNKEDIEGKEINPLSFLQMEGKCYCCVKPGHKSPDFITKDKITKYEWAINKSQQHVYNKNDYNKSTI